MSSLKYLRLCWYLGLYLDLFQVQADESLIPLRMDMDGKTLDLIHSPLALSYNKFKAPSCFSSCHAFSFFNLNLQSTTKWYET